MSASIYLGKYQILGELGKGGFATVYRARDPDLDREVALKVLDPLLTRDPVWVARFRREARAVASLDHPRVVTVHEIGQAEGSLYIAMRLVEGGSLKQRIEAQGALPWDEVVRLAGQIAEALDFAHGVGVLHRDLKPANVLLDARLGAVLTDFGFASLVADNSLSISMSGGVVGTPAYIAPEVWEGDDPSPQTDIYALGCIVYEMVSGQALFAGNSTPAVMRAHFQPRKLPETWPEGTPPGLNDLLLNALAQEPADRYAAAGELIAAQAGLRTDPLAEPYAQLQAAVEAGRWQEALALAGQVRVVDAGYRDVAALEEAAKAGLREEQLAAPYGQLQAAVEGGRWQQALALAEQVRAMDAGYRDVVALEAAALAGLEQEARVRQAAEWRQEAEHALSDGDLKGAEMAVKRWKELTPEDASILGFCAMLEQSKPALDSEHRRAEVELASIDQNSESSGVTSEKTTAHEPLDDQIADSLLPVPGSVQGMKSTAWWRAEFDNAIARSDYKYAVQALTELSHLAPDDAELEVLRERLSAFERGSSVGGEEQVAEDSNDKADFSQSNTKNDGARAYWFGLAGLAALIIFTFWLIVVFTKPEPAMPVNSSTPPPTTTQPFPTPATSASIISEIDGMEMVYVPAGNFLMGSPDGVGEKHERPQRTVYLDAYYIDRTEVTNDMFEKFVSETGYRTEAEERNVSRAWVSRVNDWQDIAGATWRHPEGPNSVVTVLGAHPVVHVTWNDARAYCEWAGRRLPTEAEWEKAARGIDGRVFPWGNSNAYGELLNYADRRLGLNVSVDDGYKLTAPIGSYPAGASPYGTLDMVGNVWEWVADLYDSRYYQSSPLINPSGPSRGTNRVLRGGSWFMDIATSRTAFRNGWTHPSSSFGDVGFRCARSP